MQHEDSYISSGSYTPKKVLEKSMKKRVSQLVACFGWGDVQTYSLAMMSQCFPHFINQFPSWPEKKLISLLLTHRQPNFCGMFLEEMCTRTRLLQTIIHTIALHCWSSHYVYSRCLASRSSFLGGREGDGRPRLKTPWNRWTCSAFQ